MLGEDAAAIVNPAPIDPVYTPISMMIVLHPTDSAAYVSRKMGRGVIDK
jgi:hypothetical protein